MTAIRHIEFWVSNLEKSLDFYKELFATLGWEHVDSNGFSLDGTKIYFLEMHGMPRVEKTVGPRHLCFTAKDQKTVDAIAKLPAVLGNILHGPAELHDGGSYMFVFQDPDSYILEVAYNKAGS